MDVHEEPAAPSLGAEQIQRFAGSGPIRYTQVAIEARPGTLRFAVPAIENALVVPDHQAGVIEQVVVGLSRVHAALSKRFTPTKRPPAGGLLPSRSLIRRPLARDPGLAARDDRRS